MDLTIINPVQPIVSGRTNLPDGTVLQVTLEGNQSEAQAVVSGGRFHSEPFSDYGAFLKPGQYRAIVRMPAASTQPPSVQEIIGKDGAKLRGSLVKQTPSGITVEREVEFRVESVTL